MENSKHHIDQFLQEQMQKLPVELNEDHWVDAERRLDEEEKKRKPFFLLFLGIVVLIGLGTTAYNNLANNTHKKPKPLISQAKGSQAKYDPNKQTVVQDENSVNTGINESEYLEQYEKPTNEQTGKIAVNDNSDGQSLNQLNQSRPSNRTSTQTSNSRVSAQPLSNKVSKDNTHDPVPSYNSINPASKKKATTMTEPTPVNTQLNSNDQKSKQSLPNVGSPNDGGPQLLNVSIDNKLADTGNDFKNNRNQASNINISVADPKLSAPTKKKIRIYKSIADYQALNPRYVAGLETYDYIENIIPLGKIKSDSIRDLVAAQNAADTKKKRNKREKQVFVQEPSSFFMMAGLGLARGYQGSDGTPAAYSFSPSVGAGYQINFSDRMSLYLSAYMSYISHLNIKESSTNITYSFDRDSSLISITRKNLLQLHLPIDLAYKLTPKHSIYGGLGINLGLNSVSIYEDSKQSSSQRKFGYMNGLRFMDVNASFGYEYNVTPSLSLGLFYQQGFFDMTKNDYFNNSNADKNSRGGVRLRYKFIGR